ncbi:MAG: SgcJ/EcaC family oxidoreductase [Vicinamibacterales bacterium]
MAAILPAVSLFALVGAATQEPSRPAAQAAPKQPGIRLEDITWQSAEHRLAPDTVVVIPLGAAAVQHGPHLRLGNDAVLAAYLTRRLLGIVDIVAAPSIPYHHFPAFGDYPGSTSLSTNTARDVVADVARSVARHGPKRFYVLNVSTPDTRSLAESARALAAEGILLRYTDLAARIDNVARRIQRQAVGGHADELETSMMLFVDPAGVDLPLAVREYGQASSPFRLTRRPGGGGTYSATGILGDPTLATRAKGRELVEGLLIAIRAEIEDTRRAAVPAATGAGRAVSGGRGGDRVARVPALPAKPDECLPGDDRAIRAIGPAFYTHWTNQDAQRISELWGTEGDMVHPDGFIEGSAQAIRQNRSALFMRPEYRHSRHSLLIGQVRCITGDVAVADAKWELSGLADTRGQNAPSMTGLATLVLERRAGGWLIEAYRYTVNPQVAGPTLLQRPGMPDTIR